MCEGAKQEVILVGDGNEVVGLGEVSLSVRSMKAS